VHSTSTLTIESHNLGERLSNNHLEALGHEETETIGILVEGARGESLVCSIEEGIKLSALAHISDLLPLGLSGVNTGGVVGTGVEEHAGAWLGRVQVSEHSFDIETLGLFVEVSILADLNTGSLEYGAVVSPGGIADVESGRSELVEEFTDDAEGTSAREGLDGCDSLVTNPWAVESEKNTLSALAEFSEAIDRKVLLIEGAVSHNFLLGFADDGEDVWLSVVVTVGTNTEVDLLGVLVVLKTGSQTENGIGWGHSDVLELVVQGGDSLHA